MGVGVGLALEVLGLPESQVEGSSGEVFRAAMGSFPAGVLNTVNRNHVLFVLSDILICFFPDLLPSPATPWPTVEGSLQYSECFGRETFL